jgi:hypothetical protein
VSKAGKEQAIKKHRNGCLEQGYVIVVCVFLVFLFMVGVFWVLWIVGCVLELFNHLRDEYVVQVNPDYGVKLTSLWHVVILRLMGHFTTMAASHLRIQCVDVKKKRLPKESLWKVEVIVVVFTGILQFKLMTAVLLLGKDVVVFFTEHIFDDDLLPTH